MVFFLSIRYASISVWCWVDLYFQVNSFFGGNRKISWKRATALTPNLMRWQSLFCFVLLEKIDHLLDEWLRFLALGFDLLALKQLCSAIIVWFAAVLLMSFAHGVIWNLVRHINKMCCLLSGYGVIWIWQSPSFSFIIIISSVEAKQILVYLIVFNFNYPIKNWNEILCASKHICGELNQLNIIWIVSSIRDRLGFNSE